jgi:hypothetical protein
VYPIIGAVDGIVRTDAAAVSATEESLSPRMNYVAIAIEDDYRVLAAIQDIDLVFLVNSDSTDIKEAPAFGQLCPTINQFIPMLSRTIWHMQTTQSYLPFYLAVNH